MNHSFTQREWLIGCTTKGKHLVEVEILIQTCISHVMEIIKVVQVVQAIYRQTSRKAKIMIYYYVCSSTYHSTFLSWCNGSLLDDSLLSIILAN